MGFVIDGALRNSIISTQDHPPAQLRMVVVDPFIDDRNLRASVPACTPGIVGAYVADRPLLAIDRIIDGVRGTRWCHPRRQVLQ